MPHRFKVRLFTTGIYRSGTTLVSRILNNHSRLWVTYDSVHFMRFSYGRYTPIEDFKNAKTLVLEIQNRIRQRWEMYFDVDAVLEEIRKAKNLSYAKIYDSVMGALVKEYKPEAIGWGEKTNVCWGQIPNFLKMFPSGKAVHVLRDPRDVMCSYREMTYEKGYTYLDSAFSSLDSLSKSHEYKVLFDRNNYYALRYEDFIQDPAGEVRKLCKFLGVNFEPPMLDVRRFTDKKGAWWDGDSSFGEKMYSISTKPVGRWMGKADSLEIFFVEMVNKEFMERFGYIPSGTLVKKPQRKKLEDIIKKNDVLRERYERWLNTGEGTEAYPSDPLLK